MTAEHDFEGEMPAATHDLDLADRILAGDVYPSDLDAPHRRVAELIEAARATPAHHGRPGDAINIAEITALIRQSRQPVRAEASSRRSRLASRAGATVVAVIVLGSAGAAAAATNHLPSAVQSFVSSAASHVGIEVPSPDDDAATGDGPAADAPNGPPASQPGASAGSGGVDNRPDCAGNPSSDDPGCGTEHQNSNASDHSGEAPPTSAHENNGNPDPGGPPTTEHSDNSGGVGSESHPPNSNAKSN